MLVDEGDELIVGTSEYIVLKKYTEDNKEYVFVADSKAPDVNIADNFDPEAIKLLMLSQEAKEMVVPTNNDNINNNDIYNNTFNQNYASNDLDTIPNDVQKPVIENYNANNDGSVLENYNIDSGINNLGNNPIVENTTNTGTFKVEKDQSLIEKILTFMFMG